MKRKLFFGIALSAIMFSCTTTDTETNQNEEKVDEIQICTYSYQPETTVINWTAFKTTAKKGVSGKFDKFDVLVPNDNNEFMIQSLNAATVSIPVNSVNSDNPERDKKIDSLFFGAMNQTEIISVLVKSITEENAVVEITMNGQSVDYDCQITVENETVKLNATINLDDFEAQPAVESLNTACKELHTGDDGVSKLWSEVEINVETTLKQNCK
jgi:polyisoprenoid-binding protein YceI